jgi:beta-lactamase regulating signal transducer with metallopeptidase domain
MNMSNLIPLGGGFFRWVLQTSWQAAVLAMLILVGQWLLRKRISPAWRYGLWLLLVLRLLMPVSPQSAFSIFNLARTGVKQPLTTSSSTILSEAVVSGPAENMNDIPVVPPSRGAPLIVQAPAVDKTPVNKRVVKVDWFAVAFCGYVAGVCFFAARLVWTNGRFRSRIGGYQPIVDENVTRLFNDCRAAFKISQPVRLIESEEVDSPAVYGLWRKWLLLPDGVFERFSTAELRCIFLHELAHIKRGDLGVNWVVALLQILHWFNPLLWVAWARMRADRELAADALALAHTHESDRAPYGETILKVLEGLAGERALPGLVGIAENKAQLKERLAAIGRASIYWKWPALGLVAVLVITGMTDAQTSKPQSKQVAVGKKLGSNLSGMGADTNDVEVYRTANHIAQPVLDLNRVAVAEEAQDLQFTALGVVDSQYYLEGNLTAHLTNDFICYVSKGKYSVFLPASLMETNVRSFECLFDGTNTYFTTRLSTNPVSTVFTMEQGALIERRLPAPSQPPNNDAILDITTGSMPSPGNQAVMIVWLGIASIVDPGEALATSQVPLTFLGSVYCNEHIKLMAASKAHENMPHFLEWREDYHEGNMLSENHGSLRRTPFTGSLSHGYTNSTYNVLAWTNVMGLSFPEQAQLKIFLPSKDKTSVECRTIYSVVVSSIQLGSPDTRFDPVVVGAKTTVRDMRGEGDREGL